MKSGRTVVWQKEVALTTQTRTVAWAGYTYYVYPIGTPLADQPGNYVWARESPLTGHLHALYAGEADSLVNRVNRGHERFPCVQKNGGTHITARINHAGRLARLAEEKEIRDQYDPPCNRQ